MSWARLVPPAGPTGPLFYNLTSPRAWWTFPPAHLGVWCWTAEAARFSISGSSGDTRIRFLFQRLAVLVGRVRPRVQLSQTRSRSGTARRSRTEPWNQTSPVHVSVLMAELIKASRYWYDRAAEARELAELMTGTEGRQIMLDLAANNRHLAQRAEERREGPRVQ